MSFWVGGSGNFSDAANHWAATSGGAPGAGNLPDATKDAVFDAASNATAYTVTVDVSSACKDLNFSAAPSGSGTITWAGSAALDIRGSMTLLAGMTRTYTGAITFSATATGKTINTNGVALASALNFTGSGGGWTASAAINTTGSIVHSAGSMDYAGFSLNAGAFSLNQAAASVTFGAATVVLTASWTSSAGTLSAASSNITVGSNANFAGGGKAFGSVTVTAGAANTLTGANSFVNLTLLNTAAKTTSWSFNGNQTISGTFKYLGNSVLNRLLIFSDVIGTPRTIIAAAIDAASNFVDFMDIVGAGAAAPFATGSSLGDCGGNSGITFTTAATQTATGTASFTWSTHGWTSRVPLPQDDVVISNAFVAGRTITADMPRLGKSLTFTCTGNPAMTPSLAVSIFGSLTLVAGMTWTSTQAVSLSGRGSHTITSAGVTINGQPVFNGPAAAWSQQDALSVNSTGGAIGMILAVGNGLGTYTTNGFAVTISAAGTVGFRASSGTLNMGASIWLFPALGGWQVIGGFGGTINAGTSTIKYTDASASTKTFEGSGKTFNNVWFNNAGSGTFDITGANTFNQFKVDAGRSVRFTAGTTQTAADFQFGDGSTIGSITAAGHTLAKSGGGAVNVNLAIISRSTASPASTFYALASTDGGNNSGWTFGAAKLVAEAGAFAIAGQNADLRYNRRLAAEAGAFAIAGSDANLAITRRSAGGQRSPGRTPITTRPVQSTPSRPAQVTSSRRPPQ